MINAESSSSSANHKSHSDHYRHVTEEQKLHYQGLGEAHVAYENLNMDYIAQLTSEGYTQDAVIRALGITRNDIEMACDILHEFATKQTSA